MVPFVIAVAGLAGAICGSFANAVAYRVPIGMSLVRPPSSCPSCQVAIAAWDNVPILSWALLGGRCRSCRVPIPVRYPVVEALVGATWAVLAWRWGLGWELGAFAVAAWGLICLASIDLSTGRLPTPIVFSVTAVSGLCLILAAPQAGWGHLVSGILGGVAAAAAFGALWLARPGAIGFGDVRLAGLCGLVLGWSGWAVALAGFFIAFIAAGILGTVLLAKGAGRKAAMPFGPALAFGTVVGLAFGPPIVGVWLGGLH
ncbi:MAG: prepilin peptidase [Acidimicrobiales bacterium]